MDVLLLHMLIYSSLPPLVDGTTINKEKYEQNMNLAIDVYYINRVNECSCGDTAIHLYQGADSSE